MAHLTRGACALAALSLLPISVAAQETTPFDAREVVEDDRTADRLHQEAVALEARVATWSRAAHLYGESAELRSYGDVQAYVDYERAGQLYFARNQPENARQMYEKAGDRALEAGKVYEAARAYAGAAELVAHHGAQPLDEGVALRHFEMARRLSESPLLTETQRRDIQSRVRA